MAGPGLSWARAAPRDGYVYATTGEGYTTLARRSARTLKQVCPSACIDLFTDQDVDDPIFDRIHPLNDSTHYPKIEALARTRFARTIMLDADTVPLTDMSDLFLMARDYPLSAMTGWARPAFMLQGQGDIPRWFPHFNSGVLVFRRGRRIRQLARAWSAAMHRNGHRYDQTPLRRLCWDLGLPVGSIPQEYNLILMDMLKIWSPSMGAPRLLHIRKLHDGPPGDPLHPFALAGILPPAQVQLIERLRADEARLRVTSPHIPLWRRNAIGLAAIRAWRRLTL